MIAERILVIKLGALGDVVMALGPMAAIRKRHPAAGITVLTRATYGDLIRSSGVTDEILVDPRSKPWQVVRTFRFCRTLRRRRFDLVYDLQGNDRSALYTVLLQRRKGCPTRSRIPPRGPTLIHAFDRLTAQMDDAGIDRAPPTDLAWLDGDLNEFELPKRFVVLVPGSSPHRTQKRWPASSYGRLAQRFLDAGLAPIIVGSAAEESAAREIAHHCPGVVNLVGKTSLGQLASLGRRAALAVGNDTGPMHVLAAVGCPTLVLFSAASDPKASLPLGDSVEFLQRENLDDLKVDDVLWTPHALVALSRQNTSGLCDLGAG